MAWLPRKLARSRVYGECERVAQFGQAALAAGIDADSGGLRFLGGRGADASDCRSGGRAGAGESDEAAHRASAGKSDRIDAVRELAVARPGAARGRLLDLVRKERDTDLRCEACRALAGYDGAEVPMAVLADWKA